MSQASAHPPCQDAIGAALTRRAAVGGVRVPHSTHAAGGRITGRSFFFRGQSRFFFGFFFAPSSAAFFFFFFFGFLAVMPALRKTEP